MRLHSIDGRAEEVLWLIDEKGVPAPVFPDVIRQALYTMSAPVGDYRIEQHGHRWEVRLREGDPEAVRYALSALAGGLRLSPPEILVLPWEDQPANEKRKRIRCVEKPS